MTCPTPTKIRYPTWEAAQRASINMPPEGPLKLIQPVRTYRCPCGGYHLTARVRRR